MESILNHRSLHRKEVVSAAQKYREAKEIKENLQAKSWCAFLASLVLALVYLTSVPNFTVSLLLAGSIAILYVLGARMRKRGRREVMQAVNELEEAVREENKDLKEAVEKRLRQNHDL